MNIIIFGPQGSGKGTQARILADKLGLFYHENGSFLREVAKKDPVVAEMINKGELIPDEKTFDLIRKRLQDKGGKVQNILFDGFPRSISQYKILSEWLKEKGSKIDYALFLNISDKEAVRRLSARRTCSKCGEVYNLITNPPGKEGKCNKCEGDLVHRQDDKPEVIEKRLEIFRQTTKPLLKVFKKEGILVEVDGERPIAVISKELLCLLQK